MLIDDPNILAIMLIEASHGTDEKKRSVGLSSTMSEGNVVYCSSINDDIPVDPYVVIH